jgi:hypothetical protein
MSGLTSAPSSSKPRVAGASSPAPSAAWVVALAGAIAVGMVSCAGAFREGAARPPDNKEGALKLELWATIEGAHQRPLISGETLVSGDRVELSALASGDAHLYLFFCDANRQLTRLPRESSFALRARQREPHIPPDTMLRIDHSVGKEALYVLASRHALEQADPRLKAALDAARPDEPKHDCGEEFERAMAGLSVASPPATNSSAAGPPVASSSAATTETKRRPPQPPRKPPTESIRVELVRGMFAEERLSGSVVATSGKDGIVVLRYGFDHR